jgi:hypothetical protein
MKIRFVVYAILLEDAHHKLVPITKGSFEKEYEAVAYIQLQLDTFPAMPYTYLKVYTK